MKLTKVLVCHPILYSFVSWRAGGCWGGGETRIPRLSVQQEEKRVARKGCKGVRRRVAGGEGSKGKGTVLQVLTINTLGPDEEDVRRGCVSHDMEPQGAGSSTTETLPAFGSLARLTLAAFLLCWLAEFPPSPLPRPLPTSKPYLTTPYILQTCRPCPAYLQSLFNQICDNFRYNTAWMDGRERRDCMTE